MEYDDVALRKVREDRLLLERLDRWLYEEVASYLGQRVLEIGCGCGNFARWLMDRELYIGIDVCKQSVDAVRKLGNGAPQVQAYVADAADACFRGFSCFRPQTVFSLNVLEHIADHRAALCNVREVLEPGGRVVLVVPAHDWLYGSIDRAIGHYRRYTKRSMQRLLTDCGFSCVRLKYLNALGALGWYVDGHLLGHRTPAAGQLKAFNRIVPLLKCVERMVPPPFGVSLLAVGVRNGRAVSRR